MKALTLTQPWASLVAFGEKRIETRGWNYEIKYRGPLAIHAAKGLAEPVCNEDGLREYVAAEPYATALARHGVTIAEQLPRAAAVAVAELVDVLGIPRQLTAEMKANGTDLGGTFDGPAEFERDFGNYGEGRYALILANVRRLEQPVPLRGGQGLFDVPDDVVVQLQIGG